MNRVIRDGKTGDIRFFLLIGPNSYSTVSFDVSCWEEAWSLMQRKPIDWIREQKDTVWPILTASHETIKDRVIDALHSVNGVSEPEDRCSLDAFKWLGVGFECNANGLRVYVDSNDDACLVSLEMNAIESKAVNACAEIARIAKEAIR